MLVIHKNQRYYSLIKKFPFNLELMLIKYQYKYIDINLEWTPHSQMNIPMDS